MACAVGLVHKGFQGSVGGMTWMDVSLEKHKDVPALRKLKLRW